jgi:hypothetical protein
MAGVIIVCPKCKTEIPLSEVVTLQFNEQIESEVQEKLQHQLEAEKERQQSANDEKLREIAEMKLELERKERDAVQRESERDIEFEKQLTARTKEARIEAMRDAKRMTEELEKREQDIKERIDALVIEKETHEKLVAQQVQERLKKEEDALLERARAASAERIKELESVLTEKDGRLSELRQSEVQHRQEKRKLEEEKRELELEVEKRVDTVATDIRERTRTQVLEEHRLKDLEKDKMIADLKTQADDFKRRLELGSQQLQGEVMELDIEEHLRRLFPQDMILPVPKGVRGADVIQSVQGPAGEKCGTIMWEAKNVKSWNNNWIQKAKENQIECEADLAVIVSKILPSSINNVGEIDGVWIASAPTVQGIAKLLRAGLLEVAATKQASVGQSEKMAMLYNYLRSPSFRQKIEAIFDVFVVLRKDLAQEKKQFSKMWAKREQQINKVEENLPRIYGDLQGIMGASLPELETLSLEYGDESETPQIGETPTGSGDELNLQ